MALIRRIVLSGFSGTGKTTVARLLGERLGWTVADTDQQVEGRFGRTIPEIFADHGEPPFRAVEREELAAALAMDGVVVATGGGATIDAGAWSDDLLRSPGTLVVTLDARPDVMLARLQRQSDAEGAAVKRPLLDTADPLGRIETLKATRQAAYDRADLTLIVDTVEADQIAEELAAIVATQSGSAAEPSIRLDATSGGSAIHVGPGVLSRLGDLAREQWPSARRLWVIADENPGRLYGDRVTAILEAAGFGVSLRPVRSGEGSKSLETAGMLYGELLGGGIERGDVVLALGGGVVGDLAGFVAATVLRGVGLIQLPTTLLAMVDSSVGGKTGINHPAGKNLIGAFYQPPLVLIDSTFLSTLPRRELVCGFAEVIKHAVIQPSTPGGERADLLGLLERNADQLLTLHEPATSYLIQRNVALKASVVAADERESGLRALLNFGHTLGHAIEAADYRYFHGEAIAIGMRAAMRIGLAMELTSDSAVKRLDDLLDRFSLPVKADVGRDRVLSLMGSDKKRVAGRQRWVLPLPAGGVEIREDVPDELVREALRYVTLNQVRAPAVAKK